MAMVPQRTQYLTATDSLAPGDAWGSVEASQRFDWASARGQPGFVVEWIDAGSGVVAPARCPVEPVDRRREPTALVPDTVGGLDRFYRVRVFEP
jgi:hypothetical protein